MGTAISIPTFEPLDYALTADSNKVSIDFKSNEISWDRLFQGIFEAPQAADATDSTLKEISFDNIYPETKTEETQIVVRKPEPKRREVVVEKVEGADSVGKDQGLPRFAFSFLCRSRAPFKGSSKTGLQRDIISK